MENLQGLRTQFPDPVRARPSQRLIRQQPVSDMCLLAKIFSSSSQQSAQDGAVLDGLRGALRAERTGWISEFR